jgi:hypothetical protein
MLLNNLPWSFVKFVALFEYKSYLGIIKKPYEWKKINNNIK